MLSFTCIIIEVSFIKTFIPNDAQSTIEDFYEWNINTKSNELISDNNPLISIKRYLSLQSTHCSDLCNCNYIFVKNR